MKKKILALCLVVALAATAVIGGTLAYFTDTESKTNTFTVGNVDIELKEDFPDNKLLPGTKTQNNLKKEVTVENVGTSDAYMWIEVWVPAALDDGDDNSPQAPGLGNSLHFNYDAANVGVEETKSTYLGRKTIGEGENAVAYNGYVHFVENDTAKAKGESTAKLLDQVYMDKAVTQCTTHDDCMILMDGKTHYTGSWELIINAVGFQKDGFSTIESAISEYYGKPVADYLW